MVDADIDIGAFWILQQLLHLLRRQSFDETLESESFVGQENAEAIGRILVF